MTNEELNNLLSQAEAADVLGNHAEMEQLLLQVLSALSDPHRINETTTQVITIQVNANHLFGTLCMRRGDYPRALEYYSIALQLSRHLDNPAGLARTLDCLGVVCTNLSNYTKALEYHYEALSIVEELGVKEEEAKLLGHIGIAYKSQANYTKALECYGKALSKYEELGDRKDVAGTLSNIGVVYLELCDYANSLLHFKNALSIAEELDHKPYIAINLGQIGNVYYYLGDYAKVLEYHGKALSISEELGNKGEIALWLGNIGVVHKTLGNYSIALEYNVRSLRLAEESGNRFMEANNLGNIGSIYYSQADYPMALKYHTQALSIAEEIGYKSGKAVFLGNVGDDHRQLSNYTKALEFYERACMLADELGNRESAAYIRASLGALCALAENPDNDDTKAEAYLRASIAASQELGTKTYEAHATLAELYERQERWQEANNQWKKYIALKDEVQSDEAKKSAELMEQKKQIAEHEKEVAIAIAAADAKHLATEQLLHNVLPPSIAHKMLDGTTLIAEKLPSVSVLFADIVNFTKLSQLISAEELVEGLDSIFSSFDALAEKHGLEKIKTIGDAYMVVSGAPEPREDHAEAMAEFALEMVELMKEFTSKSTGEQIQLRIGIHSGEVVAGVIGKKKFQYDLWGDAVNTASRMESHGEAGRIHVSEDFVHQLTQTPSHAEGLAAKTPSPRGKAGMGFFARGEMEIKGKGMMKTYFLKKV